MLDSEPDRRNVGLLLGLADLLSNLDIYEVILANWEELQARGAGSSFFLFIRKQSLHGIALGIHKIYESEKSYPLTSLEGVINSMKDFAQENLFPEHKIKRIEELSLKLSDLRKQFDHELNSLKIFRDKVVDPE